MSALSSLQNCSIVVADTSDISSIKQFQPQDITTNPSLIFQEIQNNPSSPLIPQAIELAGNQTNYREIRQWLAVLIGKEMSQLVKGYISTEIDATLSFDTDATVIEAQNIIQKYQQLGIDTQRILLKIAATWEGIQAVEILQAKGLSCNVTLIFSIEQAIASAAANATLISPFVGRIYDWYCKANQCDYTSADDPGVLSVKQIYNYFKAHDIQTIVMGASFRNIGQIKALAGCDRLTIAPKLLAQLHDDTDNCRNSIVAENNYEASELDEKKFRWLLNQNAMATEKLAEGVRLFAADQDKLDALIAEYIETVA